MVWAGTWRVGGVLAVSRAFGGSFFAVAEAHDLTIGVVQTHSEMACPKLPQSMRLLATCTTPAERTCLR